MKKLLTLAVLAAAVVSSRADVFIKEVNVLSNSVASSYNATVYTNTSAFTEHIEILFDWLCAVDLSDSVDEISFAIAYQNDQAGPVDVVANMPPVNVVGDRGGTGTNGAGGYGVVTSEHYLRLKPGGIIEYIINADSVGTAGKWSLYTRIYRR